MLAYTFLFSTLPRLRIKILPITYHFILVVILLLGFHSVLLVFRYWFKMTLIRYLCLTYVLTLNILILACVSFIIYGLAIYLRTTSSNSSLRTYLSMIWFYLSLAMFNLSWHCWLLNYIIFTNVLPSIHHFVKYFLFSWFYICLILITYYTLSRIVS